MINSITKDKLDDPDFIDERTKEIAIKTITNFSLTEEQETFFIKK